MWWCTWRTQPSGLVPTCRASAAWYFNQIIPLINAVSSEAKNRPPFWVEHPPGEMFFCGVHRARFEDIFRALHFRKTDFTPARKFRKRVEYDYQKEIEHRLEGGEGAITTSHFIPWFASAERQLLDLGTNYGFIFEAEAAKATLMEQLGELAQHFDHLPTPHEVDVKKYMLEQAYRSRVFEQLRTTKRTP